MHTRLPSILFVLALAPASAALAQQQPAKKSPLPAEEPGETLWLDFKGGSLADYAAAVKEAAGGDLNIVVDSNAQQAEMPPVSLKSVTVATALKLAQSTVLGEDIRAGVEVIREGGKSGGRDGKEVYVLRVFVKPRKGSTQLDMPAAPPPQKRLQVFPLKRLLQDSGQEATTEATASILQAIDTALTLDDPDSKDRPIVKFHTESGLMMVRATDEQISVVSQVLTNLSLDGAGAGVRLDPDPNSKAMVDKEIQDLREEIKKLAAEIAKLKAAVSKVDDSKVEERQPNKP
jgi:hypothetical protein